MFIRYYSQFDSQPLLANVRTKRIRIGSNPSNDIVLRSPFVDSHAIEMELSDGGWRIRVLGENGCKVKNQLHFYGDEVAWSPDQEIEIYPYIFQTQQRPENQRPQRHKMAERVHQLIRGVHLDLVEQLHLNNWGDKKPNTPEKLLLVERSIESSAVNHGITQSSYAEITSDLAATCVQDAILDWLLESRSHPQLGKQHEQEYWCEFATTVPRHEEDLKRLQLTLANRLFESEEAQDVAVRVERVENHLLKIWSEVHQHLNTNFCEYLALRQVKKQVKDALFGFGPLEDLLRLPTITEIMVNASDEIFIEKNGIIQNSGRRFVSDEVTKTVIERIVGRVGRRIDVAQPMVDARLPDGSRVNAVIPPLAVKGPCLTIRKFARKDFSLAQLVEMESLTSQVETFLTACVRAKRSILISGGTGTGKTTLLNCLSQKIPVRERIICIEDTHELQLDHPHVIFVECRDGNAEGKGEVVIRDLLRNALRQRPDRLIVGECRSDEALDMLQAMNTGHDGSMTTIHANTPIDSLRRLEVLVRESGLPSDAVRQQIVSAVDIVVQLTRCPDGRRIVSGVDEVIEYDEKRESIRTRSIFHLRWNPKSSRKTLGPTGNLPTFTGELVRDQFLNLDTFLSGFRVDSPPDRDIDQQPAVRSEEDASCTLSA